MQVYKITNLINNKSYIGQTRYTFHERYNRNEWWKSASLNRLVKNGIKKYGLENFKVEIIIDLKEFNFELLNELEKHYIRLFNSVVPFGYNLESGGNKQKIISEEARKNISNSGKGRVAWNKGISIGPMSESAIENSAIAHRKSVKGINLMTGEEKIYASISETKLDGFNSSVVTKCAKYPFSNKSHYGWSWEYLDKSNIKETEKTKFKIRPGITTKPVVQEDRNGNFIKIFESVSDAHRHGFNNIQKLINGEITQIKGFKFRYATSLEVQQLINEDSRSSN